MKKIIVPTDFSNQAKYALDLAAEIAEKAGAQIVLLHVIEYAKTQTTFIGSYALNTMGTISTGVDMDDIYYIELYKRRRQQMADVIADPSYANIKIVDKIMLGNPYYAIEEEITSSDADLIVMGTTGVSDWEESLIGSTAEKVVRYASCPVLTLRNPIRLQNINRIVLACDFKEQKPVYISSVQMIQKLFEAELHLVYINTPNHFINERDIIRGMRKFAKDNGLDNHHIHVYCHKHEEEGIVWFTEDHRMDMVMLATEGRTGISRLFERSIAEDVVNFSKKPVITFNIHRMKK